VGRLGAGLRRGRRGKRGSRFGGVGSCRRVKGSLAGECQWVGLRRPISAGRQRRLYQAQTHQFAKTRCKLQEGIQRLPTGWDRSYRRGVGKAGAASSRQMGGGNSKPPLREDQPSSKRGKLRRDGQANPRKFLQETPTRPSGSKSGPVVVTESTNTDLPCKKRGRVIRAAYLRRCRRGKGGDSAKCFRIEGNGRFRRHPS